MLEKKGGLLREGVEDVPALFAGGGHDGAEDREGVGAGFGPKAPGDFLFDLHHAQVLLRLIVGKRHGGMGQKAQDLLLMISQPDQEIVARAPTGTPTAGPSLGPQGHRQGWLTVVKREPLCQDAVRAGLPPPHKIRAQPVGARAGPMTGMTGLTQKPEHPPRPRRVGNRHQRLQLTQVLRSA